MVALDLPAIRRAREVRVVAGPQHDQVLGVTGRFVGGLHVTAQMCSVTVDVHDLVADQVLRAPEALQRTGDVTHPGVAPLVGLLAEARDHRVLGEARGVAVHVPGVDRRGVTDDDVADGESLGSGIGHPATLAPRGRTGPGRGSTPFRTPDGALPAGVARTYSRPHEQSPSGSALARVARAVGTLRGAAPLGRPRALGPAGRTGCGPDDRRG